MTTKKSLYAILFAAAALWTACSPNDKTPPPPSNDDPVCLNEAYSRGKGTLDPGLDWVELYNPASKSADVGGWVLSDKTDMTEKVTLPAGTTIPSKGFLKVEVDIEGGFGLSSGGDVVYLYDPEGEQIDYIHFGAMDEAESWSAFPDGSGEFRMQPPTPGSSNNDEVVEPRIRDAAHTPTSPTSDEDVVVTAEVTTGDGEIVRVDLVWTLDGVDQENVAMTRGIGDLYSATIPAQAAGSEIEYRIVAHNSGGGETASVWAEYSVRGTAEIDYTGLVINEVDGNGKFVEIFNTGASAITLSGVQLIKNEYGDGPWWIAGAVEIAPGDWYTICELDGDLAPEVDEATGNGGISPKKNVKFELLAPDGTLIDVFTRSTAMDLDENCVPDYGKDPQKYSFARCPDGTGEFGLAVSSPDAANPATSAGAIETTPPPAE